MMHQQMLIEQFLGPDNFHMLIDTLCNQDEEFLGLYQQYKEWLGKVRHDETLETTCSINKLQVAIMQKTCCAMYYTGCLGAMMNYEHFLDPLKPTCVAPCVELDTYLRVDQMRKLPLYRAADTVINEFKSQLDENGLAGFSVVEKMDAYLETVAPQLAHYYGYLAANALLGYNILGYHQDCRLDAEYTHMLEQHLGYQLDTSHWNGVFDLREWTFPKVELPDPQTTIFYRGEILQNASIQKP